MENVEGNASRSVILAIFAGFLLLSLIETSRSPLIYFLGPVLPASASSTFDFIWMTLLSFLTVAAVLGVVALMAVAERHDIGGSALDRFGRMCFLIVMFGMMAVVALFLFGILGMDSVLADIFEVGLLAVFVIAYLPGPKSTPRP